MGRAPFDIVFIDGVARQVSLRGPAVKHGRTIETEVVSHLPSAPRRILKRDVVAMDKQEGVLASRASDLRTQGGIKSSSVLHLGGQQHHMLGRIVAKLQPPQRWRFELAHTMVARDADIAIAIAERILLGAGRVARAAETLGWRFA